MNRTVVAFASLIFLLLIALVTLKSQQNARSDDLPGQAVELQGNGQLNTQSLTTAKETSTKQPNNEEKVMPSTYSANRQLAKPDMIIDVAKSYQVTLATTAGDIVIALDTQNTPLTSNNFVYLAQNRFYDGTIFHRVIKGFMIQGGDPRGDGSGGPGYRFADEPISGEYSRGTVAMANSGPNTNGSQFFIMHSDYPLPKNYVIFGRVISGLEVVDAIANAAVTTSFSGELSKPVAPVTVQTVTVSAQ